MCDYLCCMLHSSKYRCDDIPNPPKMLRYCHGTVATSTNLHGYFAHKVHGSNKGRLYDCILLPLIVIVLNSRGRSHTAEEDRLVPVRPALLRLWLVCFVGFLCNSPIQNASSRRGSFVIFSVTACVKVTEAESGDIVMILVLWFLFWNCALMCWVLFLGPPIVWCLVSYLRLPVSCLSVITVCIQSLCLLSLSVCSCIPVCSLQSSPASPCFTPCYVSVFFVPLLFTQLYFVILSWYFVLAFVCYFVFFSTLSNLVWDYICLYQFLILPASSVFLLLGPHLFINCDRQFGSASDLSSEVVTEPQQRQGVVCEWISVWQQILHPSTKREMSYTSDHKAALQDQTTVMW